MQLTTVWLNLAADPSVRVSLPTLSGLEMQKEKAGEVRVMANGRRRLVRRAGSARTGSLSVRAASRPVVKWIEEHVGELVCFRDDRGRKFFGVYLTSDASEISVDRDAADLSLTVTEVTHSEAV